MKDVEVTELLALSRGSQSQIPITAAASSSSSLVLELGWSWNSVSRVRFYCFTLISATNPGRLLLQHKEGGNKEKLFLGSTLVVRNWSKVVIGF